MKIPHNSFKQALAKKQLQVGLFLGLANALSTEILAGCGYDFLLIDAEHGPNDLRSIQHQLQVLAAYPVRAVVRPPNHDPSLIKQLLGLGVQTLLVPMVDSKAQAEAIVAAMRYPQAGIRGVGTAMERAARWNGVEGYFIHADVQMCLIVQIESTAGLDALDGILSVEGVDAAFIGPADLAASMGYIGNPGHPAVQEAIKDAIARIAAAGKAAGIFLPQSSMAQGYQEAGVRMLAIGVDTLLLRNAALNLLAGFKSNGTAPSGATY